MAGTGIDPRVASDTGQFDPPFDLVGSLSNEVCVPSSKLVIAPDLAR